MERRKHPRLRLELDVDVTSEHNFVTTRTLDASEGGLFIATDMHLPIGSRVQLALWLDGQRMQLTAEVSWSLADDAGVTTGIGVRFIDLSQTARDVITLFMKKRAPMVFEAAEASPEELAEAAASERKTGAAGEPPAEARRPLPPGPPPLPKSRD